MSQSNPTPPEGFKTCEVTGRVLPADLLVQFQGKWVGPEGKQILLERMQSGEPIEGTGLQRPGFWRRFGCIVVDWLIIWAVDIVISMIMGILMLTYLGDRTFGSGGSGAAPVVRPLPMTGWYLVLSICMTILSYGLLIMYFAYFHYRWGQTIGKRVGRIKVVSMDGSPITFGCALKRSVLYLIPVLVFLVINIYGWFWGLVLIKPGGSPMTKTNEFMQFGIVSLVVFAASFAWWITDRIVLLADPRMQRSLHDRLAGTRVIRLPPR
jgi:uncharacterized RDD family membrane protein YckC